MQTSLRAAIMLGALVGLPAAWVYYGPLPPEAQRVADRFVFAAMEAIGWNRTPDGGGPTDLANASAPAIATPRSMVEESIRVAPHITVAGPAGTTATAAPRRQTLAEQAAPLLAELRRLGAMEYSLEAWGRDRRLFRFYCEMPLAPGGQATEQFESITTDPRQSIELVLADVASWHGNRLTANEGPVRR
jgi:hypothetical protein